MRTVKDLLWLAVILLAGMLAGCERAPVPVDRPCGVIADSLIGVNATDRAGQELDIHHAKGRAGGCW